MEDDMIEKAIRKHGRMYCRACADLGRISEGSERYSLGCYATIACDECWAVSGYRAEPGSAFDPIDAGEDW